MTKERTAVMADTRGVGHSRFRGPISVVEKCSKPDIKSPRTWWLKKMT